MPPPPLGGTAHLILAFPFTHAPPFLLFAFCFFRLPSHYRRPAPPKRSTSFLVRATRKPRIRSRFQAARGLGNSLPPTSVHRASLSFTRQLLVALSRFFCVVLTLVFPIRGCVLSKKLYRYWRDASKGEACVETKWRQFVENSIVPFSFRLDFLVTHAIKALDSTFIVSYFYRLSITIHLSLSQFINSMFYSLVICLIIL